MSGLWSPKWTLCCVILAIVAVYCVESADPEKDAEKDPSCPTERAVRTEAPQTDENCGSVEGRVQICEEGDWRDLCNTNWTLHDAQVTCRSLNYSTTGAQNVHMEGSFVLTSKNGVNCSGDEVNVTACSLVVEDTDRECGVAALIRCFNTGTTSVPPACSGSNSSSATTVAATALTNVTTQTGSDSDGSTATPTPSTSTVQTMATADTNEATPPQVTPSKSFFAPPTLYYLIGTLAAIVIAAVLLVLVFLLICCCYRMRKQNGPHPPLEKDSTDPTHTESKDSLQLEPIYDSILSNENTTIHESQGTTVPSIRNQIGTSDNPAYGVGEATSCSDNPAYGVGEATSCSEDPAYGVGEACSCSDNPAYGIALAEYVTVLV